MQTMYRRAPWLDRVTGMQFIWLTGLYQPWLPGLVPPVVVVPDHGA